MKQLKKYINDNYFFLFVKKHLLLFKCRKKNLSIGSKCNISYNCEFEGNNTIAFHTSFTGKMGYGSYIGSHCSINANIGRFSCIASGVQTVYGIHPTDVFVSVHPAFYSTRMQAGFSYVNNDLFNENTHITSIGSDVWIGSNVTIVNGACIGDGAVVAAGAVITKDVEPYSIVGGVPGRIIGHRFNDKNNDAIKDIRWWEWDLKTIKERACDFSNIDVFIKKYAKEPNNG